MSKAYSIPFFIYRENRRNPLGLHTLQNDLKAIGLIRGFSDMYSATHEIDFLDSAIGLAQELSLSKEFIKPLLKKLLELRGPVTGNNSLEQAIMNSSPHIAAIGWSLDDLRNMEEKVGTTQTLATTFGEAGGIDYIDSAIGLAQNLSCEGAQELLGILHKARGLVSESNCLEQTNRDSSQWIAAGHDIFGNMEDEVRTIQTLATTFEKTGDIDYLGSAIEMTEELLAKVTPELVAKVTPQRLVALVTPIWDRFRWCCLSLFAGFLGARSKRTGELEDIEKAIKWMEVAVVEISTDHSDRASRLDNLASSLGSRYQKLGDLQDLEQAIKRAEEAVAVIHSDHPDRALMLCNLGSWLGRKYEKLEDLQVLEQAIKRLEESVAATHPDHSDHAYILINLATNLTSRYQRTNSIKDLYYILRISYKVWHCHLSPPKIRISTARSAGLLLATRNMWQESSPLLEGAVRMLPKISSRSLGRGDQEHHLSYFTRLASEAASIAFWAGAEATHCLRLLEFGRGIITNLIIDYKNDLSELQSNQPRLFDKFCGLRVEVDSPLQTGNDESAYQQKRQRHEEALQDLEETLNSIRKLPGLEGFQLPPLSGDLMAMAGEGPIVIFNSTEFRSDAIIVTSSAIKALVLPKLVYKSVEDRMSQIPKLVRGRRSTYQSRNERMEEILLWLWDVAVEPVFDALNLDMAAHHKLPRVWWIGVGLLAMAPFHAAGDHSPGSTRNTISRAISSYIPTMKALSYARQKKLDLLSRTDSRLLLVSMPTTPSFTALKSAEKEVGEIIHAVNGKATTTPLKHPSKADVLTLLPSYHAVHFACHGVSDSRNPSDSHLVLCNNDDLTPDRLTVGAISNTDIKHAQIAYLSACCTAENAPADLHDESIYIASGFQLAGFSHVLATQWVPKDDACLEVARDFYSSLYSDGSVEGHWKVSASFHYAVKKLRDENLRQPILWACYIHTGA